MTQPLYDVPDNTSACIPDYIDEQRSDATKQHITTDSPLHTTHASPGVDSGQISNNIFLDFWINAQQNFSFESLKYKNASTEMTNQVLDHASSATAPITLWDSERQNTTTNGPNLELIISLSLIGTLAAAGCVISLLYYYYYIYSPSHSKQESSAKHIRCTSSTERPLPLQPIDEGDSGYCTVGDVVAPSNQDENGSINSYRTNIDSGVYVEGVAIVESTPPTEV